MGSALPPFWSGPFARIYRIEVTFNPDGSWSYMQETTLLVMGRPQPFLHRDTNTLVKVAEPGPNPLVLLNRNRTSQAQA